MLAVSLYSLHPFFSALKWRCRRDFCSLQEDLDNKSLPTETVFYLQWNLGPAELLNSNFVTAFFGFGQEEIAEDGSSSSHV